MVDPRSVPTEEEIKAAGALNVLDNEGKEILFSSLFAEQKAIVVFIRHFFCGRCQEYVEALVQVPQEKLETSNAKIVIIGCGDWQPIKMYAKKTGFKGAIYADPTRKVYHALNMDIENLSRAPASEPKRSYIRTGLVGGTLSSIWNGPLSNPGLMGKQGNISQLGGEFIFGPGNTCSFASRMQHTEDHVEVDDLLKAIEAGE